VSGSHCGTLISQNYLCYLLVFNALRNNKIVFNDIIAVLCRACCLVEFEVDGATSDMDKEGMMSHANELLFIKLEMLESGGDNNTAIDWEESNIIATYLL